MTEAVNRLTGDSLVPECDRYGNKIGTLSIREMYQKYKGEIKRGGTTCHVIFEYEDGVEDVRFFRPCHGILSVVANQTGSWHGTMKHPVSKLVAVWTSLYTISSVCSKTRAERYWDYVLNQDTSPYRSVIQGREIIFDDKDNYIAVRIPVDNETKANTFVNLLQVTRVPVEYPGSPVLFNAALDFGFEDDEAFAISTLGVSDENSKDTISLCAAGHFPFYGGRTSWSALRDAKPKDTGNKLKKGSYDDLTGVFSLYNGFEKTLDKIDGRFLVTAGTNAYKGHFKSLLQALGVVNSQGGFGVNTPKFSLSKSLEHMMQNREKFFPRTASASNTEKA